MILLRALGCTAVAVFVLGLILSDPAGILYQGQDAAGRGMFSGLVFAFFGFLSFVVSFVSFGVSFLKKFQPLDRFTLILARGPFILFLFAVMVSLFWNPY